MIDILFLGKEKDLPNMDLIEDSYLVLPLHHKMTVNDCLKICKIINEGCGSVLRIFENSIFAYIVRLKYFSSTLAKLLSITDLKTSS